MKKYELEEFIEKLEKEREYIYNKEIRETFDNLYLYRIRNSILELQNLLNSFQ